MSREKGVLVRGMIAVLATSLLAGTGAMFGAVPAATASSHPIGVAPNAVGNLDCNGLSPIQKPIKLTQVCSDPKGYDGGRFYDNGHYVGHDEPIVRFLSGKSGSGNSVTWSERLPKDPARLPTTRNPGSDVTHWFELSVAPWFSMALCDPYSYPFTPCTPKSDSNAAKGNFPWKNKKKAGGGSAFLEMQFYPPGFGPFVDNISCDNTHWCASLHINDLMCTFDFENCNPNCIEPTNFAFIQTDGVPTGPPSPQLADLSSFTPNSKTLLMNPGDRLKMRIFDADIGGGQHALETSIHDITIGKRGFMIASASNGFMATHFKDCSGTPFNYEPEFDTAKPANAVSWAALQTNIATQYEIGHFTPCNNVTRPETFSIPGFTDTFYDKCHGAYEKTTGSDGGTNPEPSDAPCYPKGDTHGGTSDPNQVTGCDDFFFAVGDLDYDGTSYWPDWPNSTTPTRFPSTFQQKPPHTNGSSYGRIQFQTDSPASEASCNPDGSGCAVPPPGAPGNFYPYFTQAKVGGKCVWEFGQMPNGNDFGGSDQYGVPSAWFFGTLESKIMPNPNC